MDHRKTIGNDDFSLEELREKIEKIIQSRGEIIAIPDEIDGCPVASDPESIRMLFADRERQREKKLRNEGITPGEPPDDWPSYSELEKFAKMESGWLNLRVFRILQGARKSFKEHVRKYK